MQRGSATESRHGVGRWRHSVIVDAWRRVMASEFRLLNSSRLKPHRQRFHCTDRQIRIPFHSIPNQSEIRHALHKTLDGNLSFHSSQGRAQTKMIPVPKRDVAIGLTGNIQTVRIGKLGWIAIGGTATDQNSFALA